MKVCLRSMSGGFPNIVNPLVFFYGKGHVATTLFKVAITHSYTGLQLLALYKLAGIKRNHYLKINCMKKIKILYWISTSLFAIMMLGSAIPDILVLQVAVDGFTKMGMPVYLVPFLGWAKFFGVLAILVPFFPRIREWAYAGLVFDLLGATYAILASGQPVGSASGMALPLSLAACSYIFYRKKLQIEHNVEGTLSIEKINHQKNTILAEVKQAWMAE